ncbi:arylsulfatase [Polaribacter sp. Q13]|uniref:arylsulfatase n=1 Tax=Polaribacter sp. Q13 TaxID=2806551 RepID=UPI00193AFC81|nr:arylsulfatase [Polaribacter sp. Q13]QVY66067.1 arylsulfatase [Polaribacter sp. Q13]
MVNKRNLLLLVAFTLMSFGIKAQKSKKPNVIFILTDDQGYGDIAAHGNKVIKTPQLDKLHRESTRLTNFHTGSTCAPSRSGIMSGVDGNKAGVWHTVGGCNILREKYVAMPEVFRQNNYKTAMFGKWHLGDAYPYLPQNRGFEEVVSHGGGGIGQTPDYWQNDYFDDTYFRNGKPEKFEGYCTDVFFDEAIDYIDKNKDKPFFVYLSLNAPHGPMNVPQKYYDMYKDEPSISETQKAYYGMITNIDDNIEKLDKKLKKLGLKDNTILIFMTDNGTATGYRVNKGVVQGFNAGMRGGKSSQYDGGHRVPLFIRWKDGDIKKGLDVDKLTMNYDLLPTLIDLCGLEKPAESEYDGLSLKPLFEENGSTWSHRYGVVDTNRQQKPKKWFKSSVMDDEWRLIDGKELYNISGDVGQKQDIAAKHPTKVAEMRQAYERWWKHISDDFAYFEAYKIGKKLNEETVITAHDLHSDEPLAWNQSYVRDPYSGKKACLTQSYWLLDLQEEGDYQIEISRWPKESNLSFEDSIEQLGETTPWYVVKPKSVNLNIEKAILDIEGLHLEKDVDRTKKSVVFNAHLHSGRQHFEANFQDNKELTFSAFYMYVKRIK